MSESLERIFDDILVSGDYVRLEPYKDPKKWKSMDKLERSALAKTLIHHASELLKDEENEKEAIEAFKLATKAAPKNAQLLYRQAKALYEMGTAFKCLKLAHKAIEKSVAIDGESFESFELFCHILFELAGQHEDLKYMEPLEKIFERATELWSHEEDPQGNFFYRWASNWFMIAENSGEAIDYSKCIELYKKSLAVHPAKSPEFLNMYANTLVSFGRLIASYEKLEEAVALYKEAVMLNPDFFDAWLNLACTAGYLYEVWNFDDYFETVETSLEKASEINSREPALWFKWGRMLSLHGRREGNTAVVEESFEKFKKAHEVGATYSFILWEWAGALLFVGSMSENLAMLQEAKEKAEMSIEIEPKDPMGWYTSGYVSLEIGKYFKEEEHFREAIEQFHNGIKIEPSIPHLWHGLAVAYLFLGNIRNEMSFLEESIHYFARAQEFGVELPPKFWNDWGTVYLKLAQTTGKKGYALKAVETFEHMMSLFETDEGYEEVNPEYVYNYGCALDFYGMENEDLEVLEKAIDVLLQVLLIQPHFFVARMNLGMVYAHLGALKSDLKYYQQALESFEIYASYDNEDDHMWEEWGVVLMNMAHLTNDPAHPDLSRGFIEEAEQKFLNAVALGSKNAFNLLACLHNIKGNGPAALHFLEKAHDAGLPIDIDFLLQEEGFQVLRETPGFYEFIQRIK